MENCWAWVLAASSETNACISSVLTCQAEYGYPFLA
uniref:Uncharacterized protein n=1 Tax=Rhizophora mucronata TaxID=61149 RepID=A0A2P2N7E6_RHIMU